jgi:hypothetical protein
MSLGVPLHDFATGSGALVVAPNDGTVRRLDPISGKTLWSQATSGGTSLGIAGQRVMVASRFVGGGAGDLIGLVIAYSLATGREEWRRNVDLVGEGLWVMSASTVVVHTRRGLEALSAAGGARLWSVAPDPPVGDESQGGILPDRSSPTSSPVVVAGFGELVVPGSIFTYRVFNEQGVQTQSIGPSLGVNVVGLNEFVSWWHEAGGSYRVTRIRAGRQQWSVTGTSGMNVGLSTSNADLSVLVTAAPEGSRALLFRASDGGRIASVPLPAAATPTIYHGLVYFLDTTGRVTVTTTVGEKTGMATVKLRPQSRSTLVAVSGGAAVLSSDIPLMRD